MIAVRMSTSASVPDGPSVGTAFSALGVAFCALGVAFSALGLAFTG